jgi:hypothetical protein
MVRKLYDAGGSGEVTPIFHSKLLAELSFPLNTHSISMEKVTA